MEQSAASIENTGETATIATENPSAESGKHSVERVKKMSGDYGQGALRFLKQPSLAFRAGESDFVQGLITLIVYMTAFSLSIYFLANSLFKLMGLGYGEPSSLPFFSVNSRLFAASLVGMAICFVSLFVIAKAMKLQLSIKQLIAQYGSLLTPFAVVNVLAIVTGLSGAVVMTFLLLGISGTFVLMVVPVLYIYHLGLTLKPERNVFYWSIGTGLLIMFISYLLWNIMLSGMWEEMESFLSYF